MPVISERQYLMELELDNCVGRYTKAIYEDNLVNIIMRGIAPILAVLVYSIIIDSFNDIFYHVLLAIVSFIIWSIFALIMKYIVGKYVNYKLNKVIQKYEEING